MSDLKRKASNEIDPSEEPTAKRHQSNHDLSTLTHEQLMNSADAWNITGEAAVNNPIPASGQMDQQDDTDDDAEDDSELDSEPESTPERERSASPSGREKQKRALIAAGEKPGANVKAQGKVKKMNGSLHWRDPDGNWLPCVYHTQIRAELIAEASQNGTLTYDVERRTGNLQHDPTDITAFHPEQKNWSPVRSLWGNIRDDVLNRLERTDYTGLYAREQPAKWFHTDGRLIIDIDRHPVLQYPDLPATLSSAVEGWWLEAIDRLDSRIERMAIRARLPASRGDSGMKKAGDIYGLSAIGNKRQRFREREGLVAWDSRVGSDAINAFFKGRMPKQYVDRNSNTGGKALSAQETQVRKGLNKGKQEHMDKAKGRKKTNLNIPASANAPRSSPRPSLGNGLPSPQLQASSSSASPHPTTSQYSQVAPPSFGFPGAHMAGFNPQINHYQPTNGVDVADIPIPRGLQPAQVLGIYKILSNLGGRKKASFEAAIEAVDEEGEAYASIRQTNNNGRDEKDRGVSGTNESARHAVQQNLDVERPSDANEGFRQTSQRPHTTQDLHGTAGMHTTDPGPSKPTHQPHVAANTPQKQHDEPQQTLHNTIGEDGYVADIEVIDEAWWQEVSNKDFSSTEWLGNNELNNGTAELGVNDFGGEAAPFDLPAPMPNTYNPAEQYEPPVSASREPHGSQSPLLDPLALMNELIPQLGPEDIQDICAALGPSGDFANYRPPWFEEGLHEEPLAPTETAKTGSKRKTMDQEPASTNKKVRFEERPTDYTPYQPRQDKPRVRMQHPQPRKNHQPLPAHVSSGLVPPLAKGSLPTPSATPEKPSKPQSTRVMPAPHRQQFFPASQPSMPSHGGNPPPNPSIPAKKASTPHPTPSKPPQRQHHLPPYQSPIPRPPAAHNTPPTTTPTPSIATPTTTAPPPPQSIDHRYTAPTTPEQCALIITLLEPTVAQFQSLTRGTQFAGYIVQTDLIASYMAQYEHIRQEVEVMWVTMNWDPAALPRLSCAGPIDGGRWFGLR